MLDANENAHGPALSTILSGEEKLELNRYPDPHQIEVKQRISDFRNSENVFPLDKSQLLTPANLCLGVGSDESIDSLIRTICVPGKDKLLICPPTYGMYSISSVINDVEIVKVPLDFTNFQIQPDLINEAVTNDPSIKLVYVTTPGNPTAAKVDFELIEQLLQNDKWNGLVIADEAYIDFSPIGSSLSTLVNKYPNLIVLQTLSKSFGLAGIRLGITFASERLSSILNALKAPYNISSLTSDVAFRALSKESIKKMRDTVDLLNSERSRLLEELLKLKAVKQNIGGLDANFLLLQIQNAQNEPDSALAKNIYEKLATTKGVVVRYRGNEPGCTGALRITIGTREENDVLIEKIQAVIQELQ